MTEKLTKEGEQALGINEKYGDLIVTLRSDGKTLQQIGNQLGVSRERVRQVLAKYWPGCRPPPSGEEAAKMLGMSYRQFRAAAKAVGVQPINRSPGIEPAIIHHQSTRRTHSWSMRSASATTDKSTPPDEVLGMSIQQATDSSRNSV